MITQVLEVERFFDLLAATEHVKQYGGRIELSEYGEYWRVVHDVPDHDDPVHPHCPFNPVPGCASTATFRRR